MARAFDWQSKGRGFDSHLLHQYLKEFTEKTIFVKMNGVLIYFYLLAIIISLIVGFVLLVNKKRKLLASIILVFSLSLIAALIIDMIIF